jgi:fermentation-respiration switch protein FrsA (DUF1100 family)
MLNGLRRLSQAILHPLLFRPTSAAEVWQPPPADLRVNDVELRTDDGTSIHAWWSVPPGWRPEQGAVHYSHGNAGNVSTRGEVLHRWHDLLGQAVLLYDYPGYGRSGGRPSEAGCYAAARAAWNWLRSTARVDAQRVLLYGGSLGGGPATQLALEQLHRALVLVSTFTSVRAMARLSFPWLPTGWVAGRTFDNLDKIRRVRGPVFIAHGTADQLVPFSHGEQLFAAAPHPKRFFPQKDYEHHHTPGVEFYHELARFLAECEHER